MTHNKIMHKIDDLRSSSDFSFVFGTRKDGWVAYAIDFRNAKDNDGAPFIMSSHMETFYSDTFDAVAILAIKYVEGIL